MYPIKHRVQNECSQASVFGYIKRSKQIEQLYIMSSSSLAAILINAKTKGKPIDFVLYGNSRKYRIEKIIDHRTVQIVHVLIEVYLNEPK